MKRTFLLLSTFFSSYIFAQQEETTRIVKTGLNFPWEILWGKDNSLWLTERAGKLSKINPASGTTEFSYTIPDVAAWGEGGLLGMVQHPSFISNGYIYVVYNYYKSSVYTEKVVRFTYANNTLANPMTLIDNVAGASIHNGSRLLIVGDKLFYTTGDANNTGLAQNNSSTSGKVLRINLDGTIPSDNPIAGSPIWTRGHRNPQGLVFANNTVYTSEHGAGIDDEVNIIEKNRNYGWPNVEGPCDKAAEVTYCNNNNIKPPLWSSGNPTVATSGLDYYNSDHLPEWKNSLLLATLKDATFYQIKLSADGQSVAGVKQYFRGNWGRLRDMAVSPEGKVYICTSNGGNNDRIIEVSNKNAPAPPANKPPVANAGVDQTITLPVNTVTFSGSGTDADGNIKSYSWTKISGPAQGTIVSANTAATEVNGLVEGEYEFRLLVTDNNNATASDNIKIFVKAAVAPPANKPPVAIAGSDQTITLPVNTVNLSGSGTDADGTIISFNWTKISGPSQGTIVSANTAATAVNDLVEGEYEFRLLVTDNSDATASDNVKIFVKPSPIPPANKPPVANAGSDQTITLPVNSVNLAGSGTDADGNIKSYSWTKISGPTQGTIVSANSAATEVNGLAEGEYEFRLEVIDNGDIAAGDNVKIFVKAAAPPPVNKLPVANAGSDQTITLPTNTINLSGSATDADGTIKTYQWTKMNGPAGGNIVNTSSASSAVNDLEEGTYTFRLTVTDNSNAEASDDLEVIVKPAPPSQTEKIRELKTGLSFPWEILWGKDNSLWITERAGTISKINPATGATEYSYSIPEVVSQGEGGLLGMVQHPDFLSNGYLFVVYNYNKNAVYLEKVVRYTFIGNVLTSPTTIIDNIPAAAARNGSRLLIAGDKLFVTTGDAGNTDLPQDNASMAGKVLRINLDGSIPADNPIAGSPVWTKGHRNSQGLVFANGIFYASEHGASIEDEINIIEKNRNYGWPNVEGKCDGTETDFCNSNNVKAPVWSSGSISMATSGMDYYNSDHFTDWKNSLLVATLKDAALYRLKLSGDGQSVVDVKEFFRGNWGRLRDIAISPDGKIYICTSNGGGNDKIIEISNSNAPVPPANKPPTANAGVDKTITLPVNTVDLSGTGTDSDGTIAKHSWTKISGPANGTIVNAGSAATKVEALVQGIYEFSLEVTDNSGAKATDIVKITVNAAAPVPPVPNKIPEAEAGPAQTITLPKNSVSLTGSGKDADGTISSYAWRKLSGPQGGSILSPNTASTTVNDLSEGVFEFELTVTDNSGAKASDIVLITVKAAAPPPPAPNKVPEAEAGSNQTITLPQNSVSLTGSGKDTDGTISSYSWSKLSGPQSGTISSPQTPATNITDLSEGVYEFELTVTDNEGATAKDKVIITVLKGNIVPVIELADTVEITLPVQSAELDGSASYDPDGVIANYKWIMLSGPGTVRILSPDKPATVITDLIAGSYVFELAVTDKAGAVTKATITVVVKHNDNRRLVPIVSLYPNPASGTVNIKIETEATGRTSVVLYNMKGTIVLKEEFVKSTAAYTKLLHINHLPKGTYLVEIRVDVQERVIKKLIRY